MLKDAKKQSEEDIEEQYVGFEYANEANKITKTIDLVQSAPTLAELNEASRKLFIKNMG